MHILLILWFLWIMFWVLCIWIEKFKDWYNEKPSYVRQIDLDKWSKK